MKFLGDIHGKWELIPNQSNIVQVGDLGLGFGSTPRALPDGFRFIRGNHDKPSECQAHPAYIGDWRIEDEILYVSGAESIDKFWRTEGVSWWPDEVLSYQQQNECLREIEGYTGHIRAVVSHDAPLPAYQILYPNEPARFTGTPKFLQAVRELLPDLRVWVFGHHHRALRFQEGRVWFHCLAEGELRSINIPPY